MAAADEARKIARTLSEIDRRLRAVELGSQLGRSGIQIGGETVTVKDAIRASVTASQAAAEAIQRASSAEAKADGVVNTFYTDNGTPPSSSTVGVGDFWFRRDTKDTSTWDGKAWNPVTSSAVREAISAADTAAAAADGKISTWFRPSTSPPPGPGEGDIWFLTDQKNRQRRYDGSKWVDVRDGAIQDALDAASDAAAKAAGAQQSATTAINSANGKTKVVYSTSNPSANGVNVNDTWFVRDANNYILRQYQWDGDSWNSVILTNATVTSLDAGRITTGSLAAGVTITAGVPGSTRTEISASGIRAYVGSDLRMSFTGSSSTIVADTFRSANFVKGGTSYVLVGDIGDSSAIDGIKIIRPGGSHVTLKNTSDSGGGIFEVSFRDTSNVNQGGWQFSTGNLQSMSPFWSLASRAGGSSVTGGGGSSLVLSGGGQQVRATGREVVISSTNSVTLTADTNGSGLVIQPPPNYAYGTTFLRSAYYGGASMKLTSDGIVQARDYNDYGYTYFRGIIQDQSSPDLKENIVELNLDALAELSGMHYYAYDWKREPLVPFVPPPRDSSTGLLLSEVPNSVQQTADGYSTGSLLGLVVAAVNQLAPRVAAAETSLAELLTRIETLEAHRA